MSGVRPARVHVDGRILARKRSRDANVSVSCVRLFEMPETVSENRVGSARGDVRPTSPVHAMQETGGGGQHGTALETSLFANGDTVSQRVSCSRRRFVLFFVPCPNGGYGQWTISGDPTGVAPSGVSTATALHAHEHVSAPNVDVSVERLLPCASHVATRLVDAFKRCQHSCVDRLFHRVVRHCQPATNLRSKPVYDRARLDGKFMPSDSTKNSRRTRIVDEQMAHAGCRDSVLSRGAPAHVFVGDTSSQRTQRRNRTIEMCPMQKPNLPPCYVDVLSL